mmetsp:Transcript_74457/g.117844  ORF Transcript_74457/g.117844 Transcript_74457/m.117844 type:complete len:195 (-) Transcript_74457:293-877(-)
MKTIVVAETKGAAEIGMMAETDEVESVMRQELVELTFSNHTIDAEKINVTMTIVAKLITGAAETETTREEDMTEIGKMTECRMIGGKKTIAPVAMRGEAETDMNIEINGAEIVRMTEAMDMTGVEKIDEKRTIADRQTIGEVKIDVKKMTAEEVTTRKAETDMMKEKDVAEMRRMTDMMEAKDMAGTWRRCGRR